MNNGGGGGEQWDKSPGSTYEDREPVDEVRPIVDEIERRVQALLGELVSSP